MNQQDKDVSAQTHEKDDYVAPQLVRIADVAEATQFGVHPGNDASLSS